MLLHPAASQLNWDLSWDTFLETILSLRLALHFKTLELEVHHGHCRGSPEFN